MSTWTLAVIEVVSGTGCSARAREPERPASSTPRRLQRDRFDHSGLRNFRQTNYSEIGGILATGLNVRGVKVDVPLPKDSRPLMHHLVDHRPLDGTATRPRPSIRL